MAEHGDTPGGGAQELGASPVLGGRVCCVAPSEVLLLWESQSLAGKIRVF